MHSNYNRNIHTCQEFFMTYHSIYHRSQDCLNKKVFSPALNLSTDLHWWRVMGREFQSFGAYVTNSPSPQVFVALCSFRMLNELCEVLKLSINQAISHVKCYRCQSMCSEPIVKCYSCQSMSNEPCEVFQLSINQGNQPCELLQLSVTVQ